MSTTKVLNELECVTSAGILADSSQIRYKDSTTIRSTLDNIISESSGNTVTVKYAKYASTDTSKGTIEERLTNLGFKQGSISLASGTATNNSVTRQGNYCILNLSLDRNFSATQTTTIGTLPEQFRPSAQVTGYSCANITTGTSMVKRACNTVIATDGTITVAPIGASGTEKVIQLFISSIGYEAAPIINKGEST